MSLTNLYWFLKTHITAKRAFKQKASSVKNKQQKDFKRLAANTLSKSPFYKPYASQPLDAYPVLDKSQHLAAFDDINTAGLNREEIFARAVKSEESREFLDDNDDYAVGLSSGTSGQRGLFVTSPKERAQWAGYITARMIRSIWHSRRIAFFLRANNELYESVSNFWVDFRFYDLLPGLNKHLTDLAEFSPLILIAPAQTLLLVAKAQRDIQGFSIAPRQIVSVAEVLDPADQRFIEDTFNLKVDQIYQCTEGFLACTCPHGSLHLNEDAVIFEKEWLDQDTGRFVPIITDLRRQTQPMVRYRLDDVLVLDDQPCECGSGFAKLKFIEGRCDDMLVLPDGENKPVYIFADIVRQTMVKIDKLEDYRIVQTAIDHWSLYLSPSTPDISQKVKNQIKQLCEAQELTPPRLSLFSIDKFENKDLMAKRRRISRTFSTKPV